MCASRRPGRPRSLGKTSAAPIACPARPGLAAAWRRRKTSSSLKNRHSANSRPWRVPVRRS
ncbi:hypothetical protein L541_2163 [Bordetella hinzii CA90 BAL1384]|nr:hypothetical protein L541_2163 [Bordetella hinzii CA90 BAL1384]KCB47322.1 hypothetical protein L538_1935 [Bordetella hinzii 4161]